MVTTIVSQTTEIVNPAPVKLIYRADVTGKLCEAEIIREGDTMLKVQGADFGGDPRWIDRAQVVSYIWEQPPTIIPGTARKVEPVTINGKTIQDPRSTPPGTRTQATRSDLQREKALLLPARAESPKKAENIVLMPSMDSDPRFAFNVARARLNELYRTWQDEREFRGMQISAFGSASQQTTARCQLYETRYRAQLQVVAAAKSKLTAAHLAWYQEEAHRLAASDLYRLTADDEEYLVSEVV